MGKLLFWFLVIIGALFAARLIMHHNQRQSPPRQPQAPQGKAGQNAKGGKPKGRNSPLQVESMVRCAHCGIHLPRSDAFLLHDETWCSKAHAEQHRSGQP